MEQEDGKRTLLSKTDPNQRQAIAKRLLTPSTDMKVVSPCKKVNTTTYTVHVILQSIHVMCGRYLKFEQSFEIYRSVLNIANEISEFP